MISTYTTVFILARYRTADAVTPDMYIKITKLAAAPDGTYLRNPKLPNIAKMCGARGVQQSWRNIETVYIVCHLKLLPQLFLAQCFNYVYTV